MLDSFLSSCFSRSLRASSADRSQDSPPLLADSSSDSAPLQKRGAGLSQGEEPGCIFCGVTAASPGFRVVHEVRLCC